MHHQGVLTDAVVQSVLAGLNGKNARVVDATFGAGGHSRAILRHTQATVLSCDRDPQVLRRTRKQGPEWSAWADSGRWDLCLSSFDQIGTQLHRRHWPCVQAIIADLGVSSDQLDTPQRGFSFNKSGPLDMRLSPDVGEPLATKLQRISVDRLAAILKTFGDEPRAMSVARAIKESLHTMETTTDLARVIRSTAAPKPHTDNATRTFLALRVWVNRELAQIAALLAQAEQWLAPGGILAVICFQSHEDRVIRAIARICINPTNRHASSLPVQDTTPPTFRWRRDLQKTPGDQESRENPRARSARLRVLQRLSGSAGLASNPHLEKILNASGVHLDI